MAVRLVPTLALLACATPDQGDTDAPTPVVFEVTLEHVGVARAYTVSGAAATPTGAAQARAALPGETFEVRFGAKPGDRLSFASMFVQSNDLFWGPVEGGIPLFDEQGPITGDVTEHIGLWDAGTEQNESPGTGQYQAPRQAAPDSGAADANTALRLVDDGFAYPAPASLVEASVTHVGHHEFVFRLTNRSDAVVINGADNVVGPVVYAIHEGEGGLFAPGTAASPGLEALAEDGLSAPLASEVAADSGLVPPFSPGLWAVHERDRPLFEPYTSTRTEGLEALAERGDPTGLLEALDGVLPSVGIFGTPTGTYGEAPLLAGQAYLFQVSALPGERLTIASMFAYSNDLFVAPGDRGVDLFDGESPTSGTATLYLWDAGTEANEWPGAGPNQAAFQESPDAGEADPNDTVRLVDDGYAYPALEDLLRLTFAPVDP